MVQFGKEHFYRRRLKGLLSVLVSYWLVLVVFCVVGVLAGQGDFMPGSVGKFLGNALLLENSYNGAWWYMFTYGVLVVASPLILKAVKKINPILLLALGVAVYFGAYVIRFKVSSGSWLLGKLGPFGMTLFEYLVGAVCCKKRIFTKLFRPWSRIRKSMRWVPATILFLALLYSRTKIIPSLFVAPISGFAIMTLFHFWDKPRIVKDFFLFIGGHSTNIWLTHMFFYSVLFKGFVYIARYPILIFALMLAITVLVSMALQVVEKPIQKRIAG